MWIQRRGASLSQRSSGKMQVDVQWHQKARDHGKCANIVSRLPLYLTICFACCHFRSRVLKNLYSDESAYKDYDLVVVGHSLGGGCAQVLSLMLRPSFPSLRCFAYEPPVRLFECICSTRLCAFIALSSPIMYACSSCRDASLTMCCVKTARNG